MSYINKLLVANRGEIACRVMRTAKKMGIKTVAVYSDIDKNTLFVEMADEAYNIGPPQALQSYLRSDKIIDVALSTKSQAIHPGFGFLSENAQFSEDCQKNDLIFVGPSADAIRKMGSKSESKIIMTDAKVPVVPGYHGETQDPNFLLQEAEKIGFPVLIKAVMGGGGKGMRIVRQKSEFLEALEGAKREALKSFKDERVLVEKYIEKPRHIEVQIFGIAQYKEDIKRVIEEAPSALDEKIRYDIGEKAKAAARAVKYSNAGTVEFIFDLDSSKFYFMEMNTRLQVEHPITEMITGSCKWRTTTINSRINQKKRSFPFEARIYSESPNNNFLPGSGKLDHYSEPKASQSVRIETGVREGDTISIFYDPMIAKLVVYGENRQLAIQTLLNALQNYQIHGLPNNISFLKTVLQHPEYVNQQYDTSFIGKNQDTLLKLKDHYNPIDIALAIAGRHFLNSVQLPKSLLNFRNGAQIHNKLSLHIQSASYAHQKEIKITHNINGNTHELEIKGQKIVVNKVTKSQEHNNLLIFETNQGIFIRTIRNNENLLIFDAEGDPISITVSSDEVKKVKSDQHGHGNNKEIVAPMPCTLTKVNVKVGQKVKRGDILIIMEAMKMEHTIKAAIDGEVKEIRYKEGQFIEAGAMIVKLE
ncbi:unnamed protein product (macronuclear) [Paramecium tetraurelia]|uniref:Uncharacterized protein n=1 Tax=Paramecium tetraurelia TaxID=5888 RepID=A0DJV0_PARTE|nr:uncharacterized protein GSPATT00017661001 [Paramecium tetraurelia]CAK83317.1 unnamed protein product [Paramecium tetraurelia]|eukprot:XP_001450714.1 hypothetical protein (macronuclear) [Paramecium tetraurelia strain d4-2]